MSKPYDFDRALRTLNERFFQSYDTEYWITRGRLIHLLITRPDIRRMLFEEIAPIDSDEVIVTRLKADLHFLCHHCVESLFALLFARIYDQKCPWIWLTSYMFTDFKNLLGQVASKGIPKGYLENLLYGRPAGDEQVQPSVQVIGEYLKQLADEFSDRADYNSFKHGLRITRLGKGSIKFGTVSLGEELVTTYLELKRTASTGRPEKIVNMATKAIDFERSFRLVEFNTHLIRNLIRVPKALLEGKNIAELYLVEPDTEAWHLLRPSWSESKRSGFSKISISQPIVLQRSNKQTKRQMDKKKTS